MSAAKETEGNDNSLVHAFRDVLRVALPLMVSAGTFSLVLFADRTLLLWFDGASMSASMAGGNLFWVTACLPVGIVSMTGAIISQCIGAGESTRVGRYLWQSVWLSILTVPFFALAASQAAWLFQVAGQPESLIDLEVDYFQLLMLGAVGVVLETGLSGFFSGIERTRVIMWVSLASGLLNLVLDVVLIFGFGPIPALGIQGAAIGTVLAFWFKVVCYAGLMCQHQYEATYRIRAGLSFDVSMLKNLLFFGFPTGLMYLTESSGFAVIVLRIGSLGDTPLRATTMAINFNMVAFIPLVGLSIAASVLVGRHLLESGSRHADRRVYAALVIGAVYTAFWLVAYLAIPNVMMSLYELGENQQESQQAITIASGLLKFVAIYLVFDALQLILAGALRGAGDTWFVLGSGIVASATALIIGFLWEPTENRLQWWWWMITFWICLLAVLMLARFMQGSWKRMRMV